MSTAAFDEHGLAAAPTTRRAGGQASVGAADVASAVIERPTVRWFAWYTIGGSLPERYWPWVRRDVTSATWALREFARFLVVLAPLYVAYLLVGPGSVGLRVLCGTTFLAGVLLYLFVNILVLNDKRAVRAGMASGSVAHVRERRSRDRHHLAVTARNERIHQRQQARRR